MELLAADLAAMALLPNPFLIVEPPMVLGEKKREGENDDDNDMSSPPPSAHTVEP
jgi:hypothetical protein